MPSRTGRIAVVVSCVAVTALAGAGTGTPAAAAECEPAPRLQIERAMPYAQQRYDPRRLAALADGAGVRVAVVDSGVDATHPQLDGRVDAGRDFLHGHRDGRQDCVGHGTGVASIIAAAARPGVAFHGLAPGARIVPVRVTEQQERDGQVVGDDVDAADLARAIRWAAGPGAAQVINLSVVMTEPDDAVRDAIRDVLDAGVVVVAAVGNRGQEQDGNRTPYPAAYRGVIGVGAIGVDGVRELHSQRGRYVDVMAPGNGVTMAGRRRGHVQGTGTSYAAPFVAATAALIRQRFPELTPQQVARRIIATADPAPGGRRSNSYGYGVLNPYRALTETLGSDRAALPAPVPPRAEDPAAAARQRRQEESRRLALTIGAAGTALAVLLGMVTTVVRRGRRRGWRPATPGSA